MKFLKAPFAALGPVFRPPFDGLWLVVLLYFFWCFLVFPHSAMLRAEFPDTDDYTYANQVLDWLNGQGFYDNVQHRLDPPNGVPIHFSRLTQMPMAGLTLLLEFCGLGPKGAVTVMAMFYPLLLLAAFMAVLRWLASNYMPSDWVGTTAYVVLFANGTMFMFRPGHIDHHGLNVMLIALTLGCLAKFTERPDLYRWPIGAGLTLALAQTVALEVLPWILLLSGWLGLYGIAKGGTPARNGLLFGLALLGGAAVFLALTRPPSSIMVLDVLSYSGVYVILACAIAVTFLGIALTRNLPLGVRLVTGMILAVSGGYLFLHRFPDLIIGPYGGMDPALAQIILGEINEARPFKTPANSWLAVSVVMSAALFALAFGYLCTWRARGDARWRWGMITLMLTVASGLTIFYQRRFIVMTGMLTVVPYAVLLQRGWFWIGEHMRGRQRVYAEIGLLLLVGPLFALIYPSLLDGRRFNTDMLLFPAMSSHEQDACGMWGLENILRDKAYFGDHPRLIMSTISAGPELLFRTPHSALSAPYHMDVNGNLDATRFFSTPYPQEAEGIARRRHIDLVVACRAVPEVYLRQTLSPDMPKSDSKHDFAPHMIERLVKGNVPDWLERKSIAEIPNWVIYEVKPVEEKAPAEDR